MDYQKLDSSLAAALEEEGGTESTRFPVFLRLNSASPESIDMLQRYRIDASAGPGIVPAELAPGEIAELSDQPWVSSIRLARSSRPMRQS